MAVTEFHGRVMASDLHVIVNHPAAATTVTEQAIRRLGSYLEHLERCWSRFIDTSDISRINRLGTSGGGHLEVDESTLMLLATMIEGNRRTAGAFDPTLLRAVIAEGYSASHIDPTMVTRVTDSLQSFTAKLADLRLDSASSTVFVPAGLTLDPGGIGKGLAADLAVAQLQADGADGALVAIGGDLAMTGASVHEAGWFVNVERPEPADGILCCLAVSGGGVATSSTRSRRWVRDSDERHHQIDPTTQRCSATDLEAVTVIAPTGWLSEVHASAALSVGSADVISYLERHGLSGLAFRRYAAPDEVLLTDDLSGIELRSATSVR